MACKTFTDPGSVISIYFPFIMIFIFLFQFDSSKAKWPLLVELCPCILHAHRFLSYSLTSSALLLFPLRSSYYSLKCSFYSPWYSCFYLLSCFTLILFTFIVFFILFVSYSRFLISVYSIFCPSELYAVRIISSFVSHSPLSKTNAYWFQICKPALSFVMNSESILFVYVFHYFFPAYLPRCLVGFVIFVLKINKKQRWGIYSENSITSF